MNIVGILLITIAVLAGIDVVMYLVLSVVDRHWISTHTLTWSVTHKVKNLSDLCRKAIFEYIENHN